MNKEEILSQLRSGQQKEAIVELYKCFPSVRHFIRSHGGNEDEAKDVFQEALIVLYKNAMREDFVLTASVNTYLYTVCKYIWKDELKKKNRMVNFEFDRAEEEFSYQVEEEKFEWVEKIVATLGEKCKSILELFYYKKKSMEEIADQLGYKNVDTAKTQKYKCIERAKAMANGIHENTLKQPL